MPVPQLSGTHGFLKQWKKNQINIWDVTEGLNGEINEGNNCFKIKQDNVDKAVYFSVLGQSGADWLDGAKFVFNKDLNVNGNAEGIQEQLNINYDSVSNLQTSKASSTNVDSLINKIDIIENINGTEDNPISGSFKYAIKDSKDQLQNQLNDISNKIDQMCTAGHLNSLSSQNTNITQNLIDNKLIHIHSYMYSQQLDPLPITGLKGLVDTISINTNDINKLIGDETINGSVKNQIQTLSSQISGITGILSSTSNMQSLVNDLGQSSTILNEVSNLINKINNLENVFNATFNPQISNIPLTVPPTQSPNPTQSATQLSNQINLIFSNLGITTMTFAEVQSAMNNITLSGNNVTVSDIDAVLP